MMYGCDRRDDGVSERRQGGSGCLDNCEWRKQEFFNDREKAHMVDVQNLF